jgi:protein O-mannosyl-transferase
MWPIGRGVSLPGKRSSSRNKNKMDVRRSAALAPAASRLDLRRIAIALAVLAVVTSAIYSPVSHHAFVNYDDGDYVTNNAHVRAGLSLQTVGWALTSIQTTGNWHPLTWMSHALDCQLFGLDPGGHHLVSLALHVLNVVLLAWLLIAATKAPIRSLLVAALFAIHPLNVESVAWIAERKNVLSTLFFLLALYAYGRYVRNPGWGRYLAVVACFLLGLMSKPMVVTLPFVLLLADYWPLCRVQGWSAPSANFSFEQQSFLRCVCEKIPLLMMSAASAVITVIAQRSSGSVKTLNAFSFPVRLENAAYAYVEYLWKAAFPVHLAAFYPHPGTSLSLWKIVLSALFLLVVSGVAWMTRRSAPYLIVGWLWFLGTLVPVIGLVQVGAQAMADRYAYVPLIGIFVAVVWGLGDLCGRYRIKLLWPASAAGLVLLIFGWLTWRQVSYWQDSYTLWSHALEVAPDNPVSENQLGMALLILDRQEEAMQRFQRTIELGTHDPTSYLNLGSYMSEHGRYREAIPLLETAASMNKDVENAVLANLNLGFAYTSLGDYNNARLHYRDALQLDPERVGDTIQRLAQFTAAHPSARDYMKLALMLEEAGQKEDAGVAFERAVELDPKLRGTVGIRP